MHPGLGDDEEFAARFVREARSAARLDHPNVVAVFDQGADEDTVFLVMEYVAGHTLRDVIRKESPMAPSKALALLEPVLSALAHAHRAGLIHRDVKPENVLIADDGRVKVADFGLAKAISADTQHTATGGVLIGTVSYLAPELVVDGRSDARADVYAAGVLLYELLTGTKPHEGESPIQVAYKHVHEDVPPPSTVAPGLPAYVDALVSRATARDLDQRPADAGVLLHQVHRVAQALRDGVREDEELTRDLALSRPVAARQETGSDTEPEPFDVVEFARMMAPAAAAPREAPQVLSRTTAIERRPVPPPAQVARITTVRRPRRSKKGPLLLLVALLLVAGGGTGAWWFGWARYTSAPAVLGMMQNPAEKKLEAAGLDVEVGDPAYSETVPEGRVLGADPSAGDRVLDGGTVTLVVSLGKERYDVPRTDGISEDEAQDALLEAHLAFGKAIGRWSETVARGDGAAQRPARRPDPAARHRRRPLRQQGPQAADGHGLDRQELRGGPHRPAAQGLRGQLHRGVLRHRRPGRRHLAEPRQGHAVPRRPGRFRGLARARAGRGARRAGGLRLGVRSRRAGGGRVRGRDRGTSTGTSGSGSSTRSTPVRAPRSRRARPSRSGSSRWPRAPRGVPLCSRPWRCWRSRPAGAARSS